MVKHIARSTWDELVIWLKIALLFVLVGFVGPWAETRFFPVVSPLRITSISETPEGNSLISGEATKLRDCSYEGIEWRLGRRDGLSVPVKAVFLDPPRARRPGVIEWKALVVGLTPEQLLTNSYANAYHSCLWYDDVWPSWPWVTTSRFFR